MAAKEAPFYAKAYSIYGANMGRRSCKPEELTGKVRLVRVPMTCEGRDYDPGGAYWGDGMPLYCAWDAEGNALYARFPSREKAKQELQGKISGKFYR